MSFTDAQILKLNDPLPRDHVKSRKQAGRQVSYIEGWRVIEEANRIFGYDGWDRETVELRMLAEPQHVEGRWRVAYMARVRITVRAGEYGSEHTGPNVIREGCGFGSGIDQNLGSAHESALKEAETDAMKRALITFGNQFGLALYDKEQTNVADADERPPDPPPARAPIERVEPKITSGLQAPPAEPRASDTEVELLAVILERRSIEALEALLGRPGYQERLEQLDADGRTRVMKAVENRRTKLQEAA